MPKRQSNEVCKPKICSLKQLVDSIILLDQCDFGNLINSEQKASYTMTLAASEIC